jgi:DNA-binding NarL/FixJ family response regulator
LIKQIVIVKGTNSKGSELVGDLTKQHEIDTVKTRILVVDGHADMRQGLIELINEEADLGICIGAKSAAQAWNAIDEQQIDLVIVDLSLRRSKEVQLIEKIKLQCPAVPILILSAGDKAPGAVRTSRREGRRYIQSREARDKIIRAVRYVQSLLSTQVHGFTILVKI